MISNKITRRWLRNSFGVIVALIVVIEIVAAFAIQQSYYGQVERALESRGDAIASAFEQFSKDSTTDYMTRVEQYVSNFDEYRDQMELIVVDDHGQTIFTSSGFLPEEPSMPDYLKAIEENTKTATVVGTLDGTERVMLLAYPYPVQDDSQISAIRLGTSLTHIDRQIIGIITAMIVLGIGVLSLVLFSSSYFINSIVRPIGEVGEVARQIAEGDFEARLDIPNDDEIGELSEIINYMAGELGTAEQLKNDFISSVSHELRTPLTAIQGWGETILYDQGEDKELLDKGMGVIIGETQRLSGMVEELLDFSRMQSGRMKMIKAPMDAIAELSEAVLMYTQRAQRDNIQLVYEELLEVAPVYGDKNRLRQVFINIIDNAIKYSDPGDRVEVSARVHKDLLEIVVKDTGIGISAKDLPQITTKFYKADSTRRGSGIGLAVAQEIVQRHDGVLTVDSMEGKGTTITILLPIDKRPNQLIKVDDESPKESENNEGTI